MQQCQLEYKLSKTKARHITGNKLMTMVTTTQNQSPPMSAKPCKEQLKPEQVPKCSLKETSGRHKKAGKDSKEEHLHPLFSRHAALPQFPFLSLTASQRKPPLSLLTILCPHSTGAPWNCMPPSAAHRTELPWTQTGGRCCICRRSYFLGLYPVLSSGGLSCK
jgi:hypothetical protein